MQRTVHRLMAALGVLVLALCTVVCATPAFAAGNDGKIAVTSTNPEFKGKTITVYQMFNETGADGSERYELVDAWKGFFTTGDQEGGIGLDSSLTGEDLSDAAYTYVKNLGKTNDQAVSDFAKKAAAWAADDSHSITGTTSAAATGSDNPATYTAQVTNLAYGYYLVIPQTGSTPSTEEPYANRGTDAMLVNVNSAQGATQELKSVYPTLTKQVENESGADSTPGDHASAQVGDTLTFTLTSTIPDMTEYTSYDFIFHDTLSTGLTFTKGSVEVYVDGTPLENTDNADFTVTEPTGEDGGQLTVAMKNFKARQQANAGKEIKVVYKATLNKNAVTGNVTDATTNDAHLEYSNDPSKGGTGHTNHDKVYVYDFEFTINKTDGTNPLGGATFTLKDNAQPANNIINLIQVQAGGATDPAIYRVAEAGESSTTTNVVTPESGKVIIRGLEAGTYKLTETDAPDGYNKVEGDITVTITATYNEDGTLASWKVNEDGTNHEVEVVNHAGAILPGTGGMGTVVFTVVGVAIVVCGAVWYVRRSKANS